MTNKLNISRRDFMSGVAMGAVAGSSLSPVEILAASSQGSPYPPALLGLRGSHVGSFEVAHAVAWGGAKYATPPQLTDDKYDLVVVGGGLSGLAAAFYYRQRAGESARILVLENHDDFGGHAKRNEFDVDGHKLIGYGGSQSIDSPSRYSKAAAQLLRDVGIHVDRFYEYFDRDYFADRDIGHGMYFSAREYGKDVTSDHVGGGFFASMPDNFEDVVNTYPIDQESRAALLALVRSDKDYLAGMDVPTKTDFLRRTSYRDFLLESVGVPDEVYFLYRDTILGLWGLGWDALSALEAYRYGMPGTQYLGLGELSDGAEEHDEPYIFHFPDGNAGVARAIVRQLIPDAIPGSTMEDLVTARVDYSALDARHCKTRLRLHSTAVEARHTADQENVDVTYVNAGNVHRVRARHVVMAGNNKLLPHICPEMPVKQADSIGYATKVPLVYISVAIRNWQAMAKLGYQSIYIPKPELMYSFGMDFPVSMGDYSFTQQSNQPTILHGTYCPVVQDQGLTAREQHRQGRRVLYEKTFDEMEASIVSQIQGALGPGGFDAANDIAGITINRWPHGYAYEYNEYFDPLGWGPDNGPHIQGRAQIGRISIANADSSAFAYINGAFDAADRAIGEQLKVS